MAADSVDRGFSEAAQTYTPVPDVYTRIGVQPFINCTGTLTINGSSPMLPEVIAAIEQASHYEVNLDELMEKVGDRLTELLRVEWGIVTAGATAALTQATAGVLVGTDPEKIQRLPNLEGLKNEVIIPCESRNPYDRAVRILGVKIIEVDSAEELQAAIGPRTAMIELLGQYFGGARLDLKDVAPIARKAGIPILVDAATDYLIVPNPYLMQGADLVVYSGGKILRGPANAGLLVGRGDLVRAAWSNSAPHHSFGRGFKVAKEQIVGMLRAVEIWRTERDVNADFPEWQSWYAEISEHISRVPGVRAEVCGPMRVAPFPTLNISWDPAKVRITAGEVGRALLEGSPRIMTQAKGEVHSFVIRPVALKPGDCKIVAQRLYEVFTAPSGMPPIKAHLAPPAVDISGAWDVEVDYAVGSARHKLILIGNEHRVTGSHMGWAYEGDLSGEIEANRVNLRSSLSADGNQLSYTFIGLVSGDRMSGEVDLGEYGKGCWRARRHRE